MQEANALFTSINEALSKLEEQCRLQTVPEMDEAALQLLRSDLATQGDSLSDDVVSLCATLESFISRDEAEIDSSMVTPLLSSHFLPAFYESRHDIMSTSFPFFGPDRALHGPFLECLCLLCRLSTTREYSFVNVGFLHHHPSPGNGRVMGLGMLEILYPQSGVQGPQ